jgi:Domain of unknown function (DUF5666)
MKKLTLPYTLLGAACAAAILAACGGGGSDAPAAPAPPAAPVVGMPTVSGTVTGFGSVIVDGVRIDDKAVAAGKERADGAIASVELKLGQHVEVEHDGNLVATKIRVSAEVEGSVSAVDIAAKSLTVAGQTISVNADPALGPVTVFGTPYTKVDDVKVNDAVEIHGLIKTDATGKVSLQATRIEKKSADSADRVNGIVFDLAAGAHTFKVGNLLIDYTNATVVPSGAVIANGSEVNVLIPLGTVASGVAVKATVVKVKDRKAESEGKEVELGGAISTFDTATKTLNVNGVKIDVSAAQFDQAGKTLADLKPGTYVVIKGKYGSDNILKASKIVIRGVDQEKDKDVELHGTIVDFKSVADFKVRGVSVDATGAVIDPVSCPSGTHLANEMQVAVFGSLAASGKVSIKLIKCEKPSDGTIVVTREGKVGTVDATAKTFAITTVKEPLTIQWGTATTFVDVEVANLSGKYVSVEAIASPAGLVAKKVSLIKQ